MFLQEHFARKKEKYYFIPDRRRKSIIWLTNLLEERLYSLSNICKLNRILNLFTGCCWVEHVSRAIQGRVTFDKHTWLWASSVHPHSAMMPVRFLPCFMGFPPPSGSESNPFEVSGDISVDWKSSGWSTVEEVPVRKYWSEPHCVLLCFSLTCCNSRKEHAIFHLFSSSPGPWATRARHRVPGLPEEEGAQLFFCSPLAAGSFHQNFFAFLIIWCSGRKYNIWHLSNISVMVIWFSAVWWTRFLCPHTMCVCVCR